MVVMPGRVHIASPFRGYPFALELSATPGALKGFLEESREPTRWRFATPELVLPSRRE